MPFSRRPSGKLFLSLAAFLLATFPVAAQIHEQAPLPGLDKGILLQPDAGSVLGGDVGTGDFSIVLKVELKSLEDAVLFRNEGWLLQLRKDGALAFSATESSAAQPILVTTLPSALAAGQSATVLVSVKRDARQPNTGIWVNDIELASGVMPPIRCSAAKSAVQSDTDKLKSISVKVYDRALTRTEIVDLAMGTQVMRAAGEDSPKAGPKFVPRQDETLALIGGTEAVALAESGELEAALLTAFPNKHFHFRSLAWEGDTVFRQDRPMNFGSLEQQLRRVNAGSVIMMFGRQECLEAEPGKGRQEDKQPFTSFEGREKFKAAFEKLLGTVEKVTSNILVLGPPPFEDKGPPMPIRGEFNKGIIEFTHALWEVCSVHGIQMIPTSTADGHFDGPLTTDGMTLAPLGTKRIAAIVASHYGDDLLAQFSSNSSSLTKALGAKNQLWHDYWRPSNWAFLYGDRTSQPSSRDPVNPQIRFFPSEQEKYLPLIKEAEEKVYRMVDAAQKRLP